MTGAADYELRIVTRDMHAFDDFLRERILSLGLVSNIESRIVIRSVKHTTAAPLGLIAYYLAWKYLVGSLNRIVNLACTSLRLACPRGQVLTGASRRSFALLRFPVPV